MKWFKHFTNAHNDNAIKKVRMRYGSDGYAIYWYCLELIAGDLDSQRANFELSHDAEVIGYDLKIDQLRVEEIMRYMVDLGLFETQNSTISCLKLAKFLDKRTTRNPEIHSIIDSFLSETVHDLSETVDRQSENVAPRLDKNRSITSNTGRFSPPAVKEVAEYCSDRGNSVDADAFVNHYEAKGWMIGKNKMKDWKAAVRTWESRKKKESSDYMAGGI